MHMHVLPSTLYFCESLNSGYAFSRTLMRLGFKGAVNTKLLFDMSERHEAESNKYV